VGASTDGEPERTVVFVHGLWLHADSWTPWVERFGAAGYSPTAPGWPGTGASVQETRRNAEAVAGYGIGDVVDHYARIIKALGVKPIVIGHSFGGLVAQRLLAEDLAAAVVAIDPAPIKGRDLPAADRSPRGVGRAAEPGEPKARGVADGGPVSLRLRERRLGGGVE
jgi:pimeloyl-ACP methyl ester carboxylesterase